MALTIRDIVDQITELQGLIKVQRWDGDEPTILYEGEDLERMTDDYMDQEICYIFPYDAGNNWPAICIELHPEED